MKISRAEMEEHDARLAGVSVSQIEEALTTINWGPFIMPTEGERIRDRINQRLKGQS